ncbi:hypothetical protein KC19_2G225400 [Ceratodon purpureus]|uniref:Uncharacterized protein n=1 Tax=Ceratodon purpureus TaxID=3225 RepID=A0A8T0IZY4_CERPU|nr:hypothetical protein KC19_2G225400 [Ceratodon purpureus]
MYRVQSAGLCGMCLCVGDMFWMLDVADWVGYVADCGACEEAHCTSYRRRVVCRADCEHCGDAEVVVAGEQVEAVCRENVAARFFGSNLFAGLCLLMCVGPAMFWPRLFWSGIAFVRYCQGCRWLCMILRKSVVE